MVDEPIQRRLAAILAADVVGYSRLMQSDEAGTLERLKTVRREVFAPLTAAYGGRIFKLAGDGAFAEFASAASAVRSAVAIQQALVERNAELPDQQRIELRIGISLGDVIIEGGDLYGNGVNIAARMEGLADPGGVCISGNVHEHVGQSSDLTFEDLGDQNVKNIDRPIRCYRVRMHRPAAQRDAMAGAKPDHSIPDKPSIAVLPFDNMSGDREQEYFADGLAEDIITTLSKLSDMFVISRNSTFAYKGKATDTRKIAEELGVGSVLEGSVRKSGDRVRITGQLIDARTGNHLWAERYDRHLTDIFDLQDEITREIVTALQVKLTEGDQIALRRRQTNSVEAWENFCRGQSRFRRFNKADNDQAKQALEQAVAIDPAFASAWSHLAWCHYMDARVGWAPRDDAIQQLAECAEKSLAIDDRQPDAYAMLACLALHEREYEKAVALGRKAIELGPSIADNLILLAMILNYCGCADEAIQLIDKAMRLSPHYPDWYLGIAGVSYFSLGRYDDAIAADHARLQRTPDNTFSDFRLAAIYQNLGREAEARIHVEEALRKNASLSLSQIELSEPYRDPEVLERYLGLLRSAGMPD